MAKSTKSTASATQKGTASTLSPVPTLSVSLKDLPGIGPATRRNLESAGYGTLEALATATVLELTEVSGIGEKVAKKLISFAREQFSMGLKTGIEIKQEFLRRKYISTQCKALDELLGGGIQTGSMTEFAGVFRSGKTQIAHQLAVAVQLPPEKGGLGKGAAYIDTEGTFRHSRIEAMAKALGLDGEEVLQKIVVGRAHNSDHQIQLTEEALTNPKGIDIGLLIIDSLMAHFRAEFVGRGTLAMRQQLIGKYLHNILRVAEMKNIAVVVTNQMQAKPDQFFGDPNAPIGGNVVAHASTHRILLKKGKANTRIAHVLDSPELPEAEATFQILTEGIRDVK